MGVRTDMRRRGFRGTDDSSDKPEPAGGEHPALAGGLVGGAAGFMAGLFVMAWVMGRHPRGD